MKARTAERFHRPRVLALQLLVSVALVAAFLTTGAERADAWFDRRCDRRPLVCERVESWATIKKHQFRAGRMPRTPDRRIRPLREYYRHAWIKRYGRALPVPGFQQSRRAPEPVRTPDGLCWGWRDCFGRFVDVANCAVHPISTAVCLTTDVLDDGIGRPEKAELVCAGAVLITSGGNPVAVGRGGAACYWTWVGWQIFG